jgi:RNA polymerase sigma-70 factor (ECF subfamily)
MASDVETLLMTECLGLGDTAGKAGETPSRLIQQAKEGSSWAFEQIVLRHERKVFATAWQMLGNEEDARDAAQEVFLRVHKYLTSFKTGEDFAGWLYRIVVNTCRDARRRSSRTRHVSSLEAEIEAGGCQNLRSADDHEADVIRSQQRAMVLAALETLSERERAAIVLRDLEGLSTEEVAKILGSSQTTVRSQISAARTKIKLYRDRIMKSRTMR